MKYKLSITHVYRVSQKKWDSVSAWYLGNQVSDFQIVFFLLKTEIHMQIQNTKPFLCDFRWDICKTKCGFETDQFIFILSHSGLKTTNFASSSANRQKMDPDSWTWQFHTPYLINVMWHNPCYEILRCNLHIQTGGHSVQNGTECKSWGQLV